MNGTRGRALMLLQNESATVPEKCKVPYTQDGSTYTINLLGKDCVVPILKIDDESHVMNVQDIGNLIAWYNQNVEIIPTDKLGNFYEAVDRSGIVGKAVKDLPSDFTTEIPPDGKNIIDTATSVFSFISDPATWITLGGIAFGGLLLIFSAPRVLNDIRG